jgi:hypothetical protein
MSIVIGPSIVIGSTSSGLIYQFDPANYKSFPAGENLYPYSEQLASSAWVNSPTNFTILSTTSTGGPYNGSYASVVCTTSSGFSSYFFEWSNTITLTAGDIATQTWHVKPATTTTSTITTIGLRFWSGAGRAWTNSFAAFYDLPTKTVTSISGPTTGSAYTTASIAILDNGWYSISYTAMADITGYSAMSLYSAVSNVGTQFLFGGMQLEKNTGYTKYTPTYGTAVTQTTVVYDLTKTYGTGTAVNKLIYSPRYGGVLSCSSATTSGYINTPIRGDTRFTSSSSFSISTWFLANDYVNSAFNTAVGTIVGVFGYDGYGIGWRTAGGTSTILVESQMRTSGGGPLVSGSRATYTALLNTWYHYVFTYDWYNLAAILYVNGVSQASFSIPAGANTGTYANIINQPISIASPNASGGPNGYCLPGLLGPTSIYTNVLSTSDIQQLFNAHRGRYGL